MTVASTADPGPTHWLVATLHERWADVRQREDKFLLAVTVAILLHLLPLVAVTGGWLGPPQPEAADVRFGDPKGEKDGINVEVIDAAEFQRRYVSFTPGRDLADSAPPPSQPQQPTPQQQPAEEQAAQPEAAEAQARPQEQASQTSEPGLAPPPPKAQPKPRPAEPQRPQPKLSESEMAELLENAKLELEGVVRATGMASAAGQGQLSEYVRGVLRKLKQTMPRSPGVKGQVVIGIVLSDIGDVAWVGLLRSSGRPDLDKLVVERVRATRFAPPNKTVQSHERQFQITYDYH